MTGVYVTTRLSDESLSKLEQLIQSLPVPIGSRMKTDTLHITLAYSKEGFDYKHSDLLVGARVFPIGWEVFGTGEDKVLVLLVRSTKLQKRWKQLVAQGYECKFPTYRPHISVAMEPPESVDVSRIPVPKFSITIDSEYSEPLDDFVYDPETMCENNKLPSFSDFTLGII